MNHVAIARGLPVPCSMQGAFFARKEVRIDVATWLNLRMFEHKSINIWRTILESKDKTKLQIIEELADLFHEVTGLSKDNAKTVIYVATGTYALEELQDFPVLVLRGPFGTGKTTIGRIIKCIANNADVIDGGVSYAMMRKLLHENETLVIEEADKVREQLISNRYSRSTSKIDYNEKSLSGYSSAKVEIFGATVLHRRKPLADAALQSRAIQIITKKQPGPFPPIVEGDFLGYQPTLEAIAADVDWTRVPKLGGTRIRNTWALVIAVAESVGDPEFIAMAELRINQDEDLMGAGQETEPGPLVFSALFELAIHDDEGNRLDEIKERVSQPELRKKLAEDGLPLNSTQVGAIVRELDFEVRKVGGPQYIYTGGMDKMRRVGKSLDLDDDWLGQESEEETDIDI